MAIDSGSRFNRHAARLVERHGERVWRIGLDGGFGCPNRESGRGGGGCVYCAADGARAVYQADWTGEAGEAGVAGGLSALAVDLEAEVDRGLEFLRRRYDARLFFPYFQAYSSTWAPVSILEERYDRAIAAVERLAPGCCRGLVVSTRPDCVDDKVAGLLASYASRGLETWVELGLQSGRDETLARIGRGHDVAAFVRAVRALQGRGLKVAAHLILGLPGEGREDMLEGPRLLARLGLDGVKFHDLQVPRSSALAGDYLAGELVLLGTESYVEVLADAVELLPPSTEIMRLSTDITASERLAPRRPLDKTALYDLLESRLEARGSRQGSRRVD